MNTTRNIIQHLSWPPWRIFLLLFAVIGLLGLSYFLWSPGKRVVDGRHDLGTNGIWLQHGWLGDDRWFERYRKNKELFRNEAQIGELAQLLSGHGVNYVFPHLCPCSSDGKIAPVDSIQTERFLDHFGDFSVLPWVGGVLDMHCLPESTDWRNNFITSVLELLQTHPRLGGVHLNIEPMPTGNADFLVLLDELREAIPEGKLISVAAYPPPTRWHPFEDVHWDESYYREVAKRSDQIVPMMYDTAIKFPKFYQHLMSQWTKEVLEWSGETQVLLGIPAYDDAEVEYHFPHVENIQSALSGIHAGLSKYKTLPENYAGISIYCEWEMDQREWDRLINKFGKKH